MAKKNTKRVKRAKSQRKTRSRASKQAASAPTKGRPNSRKKVLQSSTGLASSSSDKNVKVLKTKATVPDALELTDSATANAPKAFAPNPPNPPNPAAPVAPAAAGQPVTCAGYSLEMANQFGVIVDKFSLVALDAQNQKYSAQGSILDKRSQKLLQRIAEANGGIGWTFTAANGIIIE